MIEARGLTKRFGQMVAVDGLTFSVRPGEVTGFLGRNGAGKTTTLRMILGLQRPTSGTVTVDGRPYADLVAPLRHVGSLLDARAVQPGCTASEHLLALASSNGIDRRRVGEVLETAGLGKVARKPARSFSLGMFQRLGLAAALLGDPPILVLDEPLNGLDPEGIIWFRGLLRRMAAEGRTVLVSSHLMAEMSVTADHLLIIGEGRLLVDSEMKTFQRDHEHEEIRVRTPDLQALRGRVADAGGTVRDLDATSFAVSGLDGPAIGALALRAGVELHELAPVWRSLEDARSTIARTSAGLTAIGVLPVSLGRSPVACQCAQFITLRSDTCGRTPRFSHLGLEGRRVTELTRWGHEAGGVAQLLSPGSGWATNVPRPCSTISHPSPASSSLALRITSRLTPYCSAISNSLGNRSSTASTPERISLSKSS